MAAHINDVNPFIRTAKIFRKKIWYCSITRCLMSLKKLLRPQSGLFMEIVAKFKKIN